MDLLAKEAVLKENTGTVMGPRISNGFSAHQFFIRYFSDFNLRTGIVATYLV